MVNTWRSQERLRESQGALRSLSMFQGVSKGYQRGTHCFQRPIFVAKS